MSHTSRAFTPAFNSENKMNRDLQNHHFARIAMMIAEERGEDLSYEEALKL